MIADLISNEESVHHNCDLTAWDMCNTISSNLAKVCSTLSSWLVVRVFGLR